ncbi:MAG: hypothetical protein RDV48_03095 [Candidatus Eremiobacteraeota bacterium]|nr:hypothetical protein [Candidatus Eremiobacteraeota bacterium]
MADIKSRVTLNLIEKYACYLDGKLPLSSEEAKALEEKLERSSKRRITAKKLLTIFTRCAGYPSPFMS